MSAEVAIVETASDGILRIELVDQTGRNALSVPMREQLLEVLRRLDARTDVGAAVLSSRSKNFSVGGDVSTMGTHTPAPWRYRLQLTSNVALAMAQNSKPIVAAVEGWAAGGGLSLALLCDTIVAAENARFKAPFADIGLIGDVGILHTLPQRVGAARARQIMLYGESISAVDAKSCGLVDHLCALGNAVSEATRHAAIVAGKAPLAIRSMKAMLSAGLESFLIREREVQEWLANTDDHIEGQRAFMEKRRPAFKGK
jgi:2-(1,2-epoxy-1,2-dihydrophenyl)acetyl-CoA isomerase